MDDHFREVTKMVGLGSGSHRAVQDFMLTRYACYLIAQNGDPKKEEVAFAQAYQLAVVHAKSLGMDVVKRWIYKKNEWTFVCGHSVPQQSGHPYFVIIKDGKAIHPKPYENF